MPDSTALERFEQVLAEMRPGENGRGLEPATNWATMALLFASGSGP